jgi:hypothetical protein
MPQRDGPVQFTGTVSKVHPSESRDCAMAMRGTMDRLGSYFRHRDILVFNFTYLP